LEGARAHPKKGEPKAPRAFFDQSNKKGQIEEGIYRGYQKGDSKGEEGNPKKEGRKGRRGGFRQIT
jgi:hypothetical protein